MMTQPLPITSTTLLSHDAHRQADDFCQQHRNIQKAEQVYLNTLAIYAVYDYLRDRGVNPNFDQSDSWDPIFRNCLNIADLMVPAYGRLECRPLRTGDRHLIIPPETRDDRLSYIAVELDDALEQATLLGFITPAVVKSTQREAIALTHLHPIEELQSYLEEAEIKAEGRRQKAEEPTPNPSQEGDRSCLTPQLHNSVTPQLSFQNPKSKIQNSSNSPETHLKTWFTGQIDDAWQTLDKLLGIQSLALQTRSVPKADATSPPALASSGYSEMPGERLSRGKLIDLPSKTEPTALVVQIFPIESSEVLISVKLCPVGTHTHLHSDLDVQIRDDTGETVIQAQTRNTKMIDIEFSAEVGDRFSVAVRLDDSEHVEHFTV
ncbi:MAG: DUF1822 family protein [Cyanobacteria bacterium P01_F01_bin.150]